MKKSNFVALILGTVSGVLFSLGMCMALLPEWESFDTGVIFGALGIVFGILTFAVWCKMEGKKMPKINIKTFFVILFAVVALLTLGVGMCLCLVWEKIIFGTLIGLLGIIMLISLIPITKGVK